MVSYPASPAGVQGSAGDGVADQPARHGRGLPVQPGLADPDAGGPDDRRRGTDQGTPRFAGPPEETVKLSVEIDATDQLEAGDSTTESLGILPALAALEAHALPAVGDRRRQRGAGPGRHRRDPADGGAAHPAGLGRPADPAGVASPSSRSPRRPSTSRSTRCRPRSTSGSRCSATTSSGCSARAARCRWPTTSPSRPSASSAPRAPCPA